MFGCAPLIVGIVFGLDPSWTIFLVPFIAALTGFGFASLGTFIAAAVKLDRQLQLRHERAADADVPRCRHVLPDLRAPEWAQVLSQANPLHHCVELVRSATFDFDDGALEPLAGVGALIAFAAVMWKLACWRSWARLIVSPS